MPCIKNSENGIISRLQKKGEKCESKIGILKKMEIFQETD